MLDGAKAHLFTRGALVDVVYKGQKLRGTVIRYNGRHVVVVKLNELFLQVTVTVTKRWLRSDLVEETVEWIKVLSVWEDDVTSA